MTNITSNIKYWPIFWFVSIVFFACEFTRPFQPAYNVIPGKTMGTYYKITCDCANAEIVKRQVDSILIDINNFVSVYEADSYISRINKSPAGSRFENLPEHFKINLERAVYWHQQSEGYLDVSVMPLINYWGFGYMPKKAVTIVDSLIVDSLNQYTGLSKWKIEDDAVTKILVGQEFDFASLAKGYAVDKVGELLESTGSYNYLIDIGGELVTRGVNDKKDAWVIGISTPRPEAHMDDFEVLLKLSNKALASSGNYRNYYEVDQRKYGHTIDPKTGYPYQDELLGVSIIADQCIDADAIATACMAMGYIKATTFISKLSNVSACFLIGDEAGAIQTKFVNGFIQYIIEPES